MQLVKCTDPTKRGIALEQTLMSVMVTGDWTVKSFYGDDENWYEQATHEDGGIMWYRLKGDENV